MNKQLEANLIKRFPDFFVDMYGDPRVTSMHWGCTCGDGWYDLLYKLCEDIEATNPPEGFKIAQVKEKFGGLRFYVTNATDAIYDLIRVAEEKAELTCEECGTMEDVAINARGYLRTLCQNCRTNKKCTSGNGPWQ